MRQHRQKSWTMPSHSKWYGLRERQKRERIEQVEALARSRITQTEAAAELGVTLQVLNRFIQLNNIHWPVIKQGVKTNGSDQRNIHNKCGV